MKRALSTIAATAIGVYWLVTFKITPAPVDVPVVSPPSPRATPEPGGTAQPAASATNPPAGGGAPVTGATVETLFGPVEVEVALAGGKLVDVQAVQLPFDRARSARISQYVAPILRSEAIQAQSAQVDIVSGATYTSVAYARSLDSAIKRAEGR
ncbi:MAG: FMN-binding protein [Candidatus Limnocylindria bacterium]